MSINNAVSPTLLAILLAIWLSAAPAAAQPCGNHAVEGDEQCDDGNVVGGDGCAANCTDESQFACELASGSMSTIDAAFFSVPVALRGIQTLTLGRARASDASGTVPFVVRAGDAHFAPGKLPGIACVCTRAVVAADLLAVGVIGCAPGGLPETSYTSVIDQASQTSLTFAAGPQGSARLTYAMQSYQLSDGGMCCAVGVGNAGRAQGADGEPCTADDPGATASSEFILTTGSATGRVLGGASPLERTVTGGPAIDCAALAANPSGALTGVSFVAAVPALSLPQLGDAIRELVLKCAPASNATPSPTCGVPPTFTPTATPPATLVATATPPPTTPTAIATATRSASPPLTAAAPTSTPTAAATDTPSSGPTATVPPGGCVGDCNGNLQVSVDELVRGVNLALGSLPLSACPAFDADGSGAVTVAELIQAVNNALNQCG